MDIKKVLKINSNVEITVIDQQTKAKHFGGKSIIQEVNDDSFSIMVPTNKRYYLYLNEGNEVIVTTFINNVRYIFKSKVLGEKKEADILFFELEYPQKISVSERRGLVRTKTFFSIKYEVIPPEKKDNWKNILLHRDAYVTDLGGEGAQLVIESPVLKDDLLVLLIPLKIAGMDKKVHLLGKVVWKSHKVDCIYKIGINFIDITERQQDLIIQYVFYKMRKNMYINRDDY